MDEKLFEAHSSEDDTFQASMIALHGSTCSADLDYQMSLDSSKPSVSLLYKRSVTYYLG